MKLFPAKRIFAMLSLALFLSVGTASAEIERTVEPFSGAITYTSKYMFSDEKRNMHSIALIKTIKPLKATTSIQQFDTDAYFLLNFSLPNNDSLGETFDIQVNDFYINALPLSPYLAGGGIGLATAPTARTAPLKMFPMTTAAIEKGKELFVRINFSPRGNLTHQIPESVIKEWDELLKETGAEKPKENKPEQDTAK